ncbi:arylsulfatase [Stratiformator vulcanicus]|uniref:Arylsulfatase n=1 Tax=Stratiformator vulcanicus TaxID=2527980 RepID=A0A517R7R4_9PLAN|nr:arylsulfatase [Stratiformator vulcanicus]QDT39928.1 Arylsulfatase precursor [Stratiformator vulcanicus]
MPSFGVCVRRITLCLAVAAFALPASAADRPPNVIFMMADDLGYGDLGCYGNEKIRTPHLDRMAGRGMRFTDHYTGFPVCAPSRCSLMTGYHAGHCYIRGNSKAPGRPSNYREEIYAGERPIPDETVTLAELFQDADYATAAIGKWGLGYVDSEGDPLAQGFDLYFGFVSQTHAHNHYPTFLRQNDETIRYQGNRRGLSDEVHSQDEFIRVAKGFITGNSNRPFFLYLPFTIPHVGIQVPEETLAEYAGEFKEEPYKKSRHYANHPQARAAYAAMITHMDRGIGELVSLVDKLGLTGDTIFIFTSDNGPAVERLAGTDSTFFNSSGGLRGRKRSLYEGGIREPLIVQWSGKVPAGTVSDLPTYFPDWMPTLVGLTGIGDGAMPADIDGIDFAPTLLGRPEDQVPHEFLYWEFTEGGHKQAVRRGKWKAIRPNTAKSLRTELYDLEDDPGETSDVAASHPAVVAELEAIMAREHTPSELFPLNGIDTPVK